MAYSCLAISGRFSCVSMPSIDFSHSMTDSKQNKLSYYHSIHLLGSARETSLHVVLLGLWPVFSGLRAQWQPPASAAPPSAALAGDAGSSPPPGRRSLLHARTLARTPARVHRFYAFTLTFRAIIVPVPSLNNTVRLITTLFMLRLPDAGTKSISRRIVHTFPM